MIHIQIHITYETSRFRCPYPKNTSKRKKFVLCKTKRGTYSTEQNSDYTMEVYQCIPEEEHLISARQNSLNHTFPSIN